MMMLGTILIGLALNTGGPQAMQMTEGGTADLVIDAARRGRARLSLMRADGVELAWIEGDVALPSFDGAGLVPDQFRFDAPRLDGDGPSGAQPGDSLRLVVDRDTALRDGGISGATGAISGDDGLMRLSSLASGEGEYDIYDLTLSWDAFRPGPVTVSFIGGLKAIDARFGRTIDDGGTGTYRDARGVVAVPVVGGGVSWAIADGFALSGTASTQTFDGQGTVLDMSAETSIRLAPNVGLSAGYQFIRSAIEVQSLSAQLEREGVYARIQILF